MKWGEIPSTGGLRSFVAAAQHGSFTRAARELGLSQGAVSRQIRELEDHLGIRLFERIRQRVVLTKAGEQYLWHVKKPLDDLAAASQKVVALSDGTILNLSVSPTFAARWLMERLPAFQKKNPSITIHLTTPQSPAEFLQEPFDVAIFYGSPNWPGTIAHLLMEVDMIAVCSPNLKATCAINTPADVAKFPLLHHSSNRWTEWLAEAGITLDGPLPGHTYQNFAMVAQAAVAGLGIALLPRYVVEKELADKQLEIVGRHIFATKVSYYLIVPEAHASSCAVLAFSRWLLAEVRKYSSNKDWTPEAKTGRDLLMSI